MEKDLPKRERDKKRIRIINLFGWLDIDEKIETVNGKMFAKPYLQKIAKEITRFPNEERVAEIKERNGKIALYTDDQTERK